jgi:hypothetical protein
MSEALTGVGGELQVVDAQRGVVGAKVASNSIRTWENDAIVGLGRYEWLTSGTGRLSRGVGRQW